jgi:methyltransferase (TIGR00027 family)
MRPRENAAGRSFSTALHAKPVQEERASGTASLIAASLVFMHEHAEFKGLVSAESARLCRRFLGSYSQKSDWFWKIARQRWFFHLALTIERLTIPGILQHYALRKKCLSRLVREAFADGIPQMVVLGAGFDPLALELYQEFKNIRFWEVDHPATQRYKAAAVEVDVLRFHFVALDLQKKKLDSPVLIHFNESERTTWVAEGLLMYLPAPTVKEHFEQIAKLSSPCSRFLFTFMEPEGDGRIQFRGQTRLVDCWLRGRGEPFSWGIDRHELPRFIYPWQSCRIFDDTDLRELGSLGREAPLAAGELICLAELP